MSTLPPKLSPIDSLSQKPAGTPEDFHPLVGGRPLSPSGPVGYVREAGAQAKKASVIVSCPHAGFYTPAEFEALLNPAISLTDVLNRGDIFTDWLTVSAPDHGLTQIFSLVAPSYLNIGRATTSIALDDVPGGLHTLTFNPDDPYVQKQNGQGLVATRTLLEGMPIYAQGRNPDERDIQDRITRFYDPYHAELERLATGLTGTGKPFLVFDIHSCPSRGKSAHKDSGAARKDIIIGDNNGKSCDAATTRALADLARTYDFSVSLNEPYTGGFITQKFARKPVGPYSHYPWGALGSQSIQIEFNRETALGMDEDTMTITDMAAFEKAQRFMDDTLKMLAQRYR